MNTRIVISVILGASLVGGCTLAPEYSRPDAPVPEQWPQGDAYPDAIEADGQKAPLQLTWREFFTDHKLQEVIAISLDNNRDLRLAILNVERSRALYGISRAELYPSVNAAGSGARQRASTDFTAPGQSKTSKQYDVNLAMVAWEIDLFGRVRSLADEALEGFLATRQAQNATQILLVSSVADAYLTLAASLEALDLSSRTLDTQREAYDLVKRQYDAGIATELDLRRAQTPVEIARGDVARYTQLAAEARNALNLLAGTVVPDELLPAADLGTVSPPTPIAAGLKSDVLLLRPDIMGAEHRLRGAYARIGAARAAFFPRISLTTSLGTASVELHDLFSSGMGTWSYGAQIVMPVFDPRIWAALKASKVEREIALTEYERAIQVAFREVADTLAVNGTVGERVAAQQALVDALDDTYRLARSRFDQGIDSYLGVLDAQRSLFDAQQGLIALRLLELSNQVRLYAVLGGGWQPVDMSEVIAAGEKPKSDQ